MKIGFFGSAISTTLGELSSFSDVLPSELLGILYGRLIGRATFNTFAGVVAKEFDVAPGEMTEAFGGDEGGFPGPILVAKGFLSGLAVPNCGAAARSCKVCKDDFCESITRGGSRSRTILTVVSEKDGIRSEYRVLRGLKPLSR